MRFQANTMPAQGQDLTSSDLAFCGRNGPQMVRPYLQLWPHHATTPLYRLDALSSSLGLDAVFVKDEGVRLGEGSFKALGGAYAVVVLFHEWLRGRFGRDVAIGELTGDEARHAACDFIVTCATDGNHGRSVAAGARLIGARSVIFVHAGVSDARIKAIGADEIVRVQGSYDDSVEEAGRVCEERGWNLVSDTSWPGYERVPSRVAQGYTILAEEALEQMAESGGETPTHVFLQAGVGGFAGSMACYLTDRLGASRPVIVVVEPDRAACVFESARAGQLIRIEEGEPTIMAMLECYRPSLVGWRILERSADGFMTISEDDVKEAMRRLARPAGSDPRIKAGESGAASLAGLIQAASDPAVRAGIGLDGTSRVLIVNTETATDPASYAAILREPPLTEHVA